MKSNSKTMGLFSLAVLVSLALTAMAAKPETQPASSSSLASKLLPAQTKARTSRSLSDMFEKMRSKIFGSRKQQQQQQQQAAASSNVSPLQVSPSTSVNMGQRQPWADLNSFNSQYSPYGSYQFPAQSGQFAGQQYGNMGAYSSGAFPQMTINAQGQLSAGNPLDPSQQVSSAPASSSSAGLQPQQQQQQPPGGSSGGLLSSASHLIAQYLSPSGGNSNQPANQQQQVNGQAAANGQQQSQSSLMSPQSQTQYNEFASILDSMVAQTGNTVQRQPTTNNMGQYMQNAGGQPSYQPTGSQMGGDQDMSGSSVSQSYSLPAAAASASSAGAPMSQPAASAKSSMVSLAEQLAPGAQFNKLVSFPFSISNNDDSNKEGRYKLHIPFLNQHVKRSDQQQQQVSTVGQQQQQRQLAQQYLSAHYQQQQQQQPQVMAAPSGPQQVQAGAQVQQQQQQSSSSVMLSQGPSQVASAVVSQQAANNRPAWSVADLQVAASAPAASISSSAPSPVSAVSSGQSSPISPSPSSSSSSAAASSSKLIPMASASSVSAGDQQADPSHQ